MPAMPAMPAFRAAAFALIFAASAALSAAALSAAALLALAMPAEARGNLSARAERITIELGAGNNDFHLKPRAIELETGKAYRITIVSQGFKEYRFSAPQFFRNVWLKNLSLDDITIEAAGLQSIAFEEAHEELEAEMTIVPIRPGAYPYALLGLESRGMTGVFNVK